MGEFHRASETPFVDRKCDRRFDSSLVTGSRQFASKLGNSTIAEFYRSRRIAKPVDDSVRRVLYSCRSFGLKFVTGSVESRQFSGQELACHSAKNPRGRVPVGNPEDGAQDARKIDDRKCSRLCACAPRMRSARFARPFAVCLLPFAFSRCVFVCLGGTGAFSAREHSGTRHGR